MKINENGIIRDMTPEEEAKYNTQSNDDYCPSKAMTMDYDEAATYKKGDCVEFKDALYRLKTERARGIEPTDKTYWENISLTDLIKEISKENEQ